MSPGMLPIDRLRVMGAITVRLTNSPEVRRATTPAACRAARVERLAGYGDAKRWRARNEISCSTTAPGAESGKKCPPGHVWSDGKGHSTGKGHDK